MRKRSKLISIKRPENDQGRLRRGVDTGKSLSTSGKGGNRPAFRRGRTIERLEQETNARWDEYCQKRTTMPNDAVMAWLDSWVADESVPTSGIRIEWLPGAISDLQRLKNVIFSDYMEAADRVVVSIKSSIKMLSQYERIGIPTEDMPGDHDIIIPFEGTGYVLSTRVEGDTAFIIGVKHGKEAGFSDTKRRN